MTDEPNRGARETEQDMREAAERTEPAPDEMERRSEQLEEEIAKTERDWERKRQDPSVPGAQPELEDVETHRQDLGGAPGGDD